MNTPTIQDEAVGAYPIAYVTLDDKLGWILNYPSGSIAVFPSQKMAVEYANQYNKTEPVKWPGFGQDWR